MSPTIPVRAEPTNKYSPPLNSTSWTMKVSWARLNEWWSVWQLLVKCLVYFIDWQFSDFSIERYVCAVCLFGFWVFFFHALLLFCSKLHVWQVFTCATRKLRTEMEPNWENDMRIFVFWENESFFDQKWNIFPFKIEMFSSKMSFRSKLEQFAGAKLIIIE